MMGRWCIGSMYESYWEISSFFIITSIALVRIIEVIININNVFAVSNLLNSVYNLLM